MTHVKMISCSMCGDARTFWEEPPALPDGWLRDPEDDEILCSEACLRDKREGQHRIRVSACPNRLDELEERVEALEKWVKNRNDL